MIRTLCFAALLMVGASVLVGCGGDDGAAADDGATVVEAGDQADVDARDNQFRPEHISIAPGTQVVWTNRGRNTHDVEPVDGDDWGVMPDAFGPDATYAHTFDEPGRYEYYCSLHGTETRGMIGAVIVREQ